MDSDTRRVRVDGSTRATALLSLLLAVGTAAYVVIKDYGVESPAETSGEQSKGLLAQVDARLSEFEQAQKQWQTEVSASSQQVAPEPSAEWLADWNRQLSDAIGKVERDASTLFERIAQADQQASAERQTAFRQTMDDLRALGTSPASDDGRVDRAIAEIPAAQDAAMLNGPANDARHEDGLSHARVSDATADSAVRTSARTNRPSPWDLPDLGSVPRKAAAQDVADSTPTVTGDPDNPFRDDDDPAEAESAARESAARESAGATAVARDGQLQVVNTVLRPGTGNTTLVVFKNTSEQDALISRMRFRPESGFESKGTVELDPNTVPSNVVTMVYSEDDNTSLKPGKHGVYDRTFSRPIRVKAGEQLTLRVLIDDASWQGWGFVGTLLIDYGDAQKLLVKSARVAFRKA